MNQLTITLMQSYLHWEDKPANLKMFEEKINQLKEKTAIVILPEMFSTGFTMNAAALAEDMNGPTIMWMKHIAATHKIILVGSIIIKESSTTSSLDGKAKEERYYNRLIWMLPNGRFGQYDKRHLFCMAGEQDTYTPGDKRLIASVNGWKINLQICYDLRFPVWNRQTPANTPEYDVLINIASWGAPRRLAWKTLLQARAIENQAYVIGVNRIGNDGAGNEFAGDSMVIDPVGTILYHKETEEDLFTITLQKEKLEETRTIFPFWKDGDGFNIF